MVRYDKGKIVLSEKDFNNLKQEINVKGKIVYVIYPSKNENIIDEKKLEEFIINKTKIKDILQFFKVSAHYLNKTIKEKYHTTSLNVIRGRLTNIDL